MYTIFSAMTITQNMINSFFSASGNASGRLVRYDPICMIHDRTGNTDFAAYRRIGSGLRFFWRTGPRNFTQSTGWPG
jgi:hypothetical protein